MTLSPQLNAFVRGEFGALVTSFRAAGFDVQLPAAGVVQLMCDPAACSVLISVGIHGDETAPIELVARLLQELSEAPSRLRVNLMLVVGNMDAIARAQRFVEVDLNRLFRAEQGDLAAASEAIRARAIMAASATFFANAQAARWHLDLHTAIRGSVYPTFAIVPALIDRPHKLALLRLLGQGGIAAAIINPTSAGTFSAYTAHEFSATSATVELGQVAQLGQNDVTVFSAMGEALAQLLAGEAYAPSADSRHMTATDSSQPLPLVFAVAQEIIKHSEAFKMTLDGNTQNFTPLQRGEVIATDGALTYRVEHACERIVFPNPAVRPGFRAGLMVVPTTL